MNGMRHSLGQGAQAMCAGMYGAELDILRPTALFQLALPAVLSTKSLICFVALDRFRVNVQEYASARRSSRVSPLSLFEQPANRVVRQNFIIANDCAGERS